MLSWTLGNHCKAVFVPSTHWTGPEGGSYSSLDGRNGQETFCHSSLSLNPKGWFSEGELGGSNAPVPSIPVDQIQGLLWHVIVKVHR